MSSSEKSNNPLEEESNYHDFIDPGSGDEIGGGNFHAVPIFDASEIRLEGAPTVLKFSTKRLKEGAPGIHPHLPY